MFKLAKKILKVALTVITLVIVIDVISKPPSVYDSSGESGTRDSLAILNAAKEYLGASYQAGAREPPYRFDCSGLVSQAYLDAAGISIPRNSSQIWAQGKKIDDHSVQPGDIIVFGERGTPNHVAIYIDETSMIHSASSGTETGVVISRQDENYWSQRFMGYVTFMSNIK